jgi:hypothetical protein
MFVNAPFSKFDLGRHAFGAGLGLPRIRLGQQSAYALDDYLQKIENVSDKETRDKLNVKYKECQDKSDTTAQAVCYLALANDIYQASKDQDSKPKPAPTIAMPTQQASPFPIVPVAIAGVAAIGLIGFLVWRGKK